jgi:type IV pilus assembly protein PilW
MCSSPESDAARRARRHGAPGGRQRGFSLVELMVGATIGLLVIGAVSTMLTRNEGLRRAMAASVDLTTGSGHLAYHLDRSLRSAGSGFVQTWNASLGCALHAARGPTTLLPSPTPFPAPFGNVPQTVRLLPVLAHGGAGAGGSDVLALAAGHSGRAETPFRALPAAIGPSGVRLPTTLSLRGGDLLMLAEPGRHCLIQQVAAGFVGGTSQDLPLGGDYAPESVTGPFGIVARADYNLDAPAWVLPIGRAPNSAPVLRLYAVGTDRTLYSLDLLRTDGTAAPVPLESGVLELRARYGLDTDATPGIDTWVGPDDPGFTAAELTDGSAQAAARLETIVAIRVGLILRDTQVERTAVAPPTLVLFPDLPTAQRVTRAVSEADRTMRHRTLELTVPLRNVLARNAQLDAPPAGWAP